MTVSTIEWRQLRRILYEANLGWMFEGDRTVLASRLEVFADIYAQKTADIADRTFPKSALISDLLKEYNNNPHRVKALFQAIAFNCSPEILAMIWAVLLGARIEQLHYDYKRRVSSQLMIDVHFPDGTRKPFVGNDLWDAAALRLLSLSKVGGQPLIESFYPLHLPKASRGSSFFWILEVLEWLERSGSTLAFSPSLVDHEHVSEIADAIVDGIKRSWLEPEPKGAFSEVRSDAAAAERARDLLRHDTAILITLTADGRRALRRGRFYRQLRPAGASTLEMIKGEIERVLGNPSPEYLPADLDEIRDELDAIKELLQEAG